MSEIAEDKDHEKELQGVTPSERYLGKLARRSFLSLWSYSNLYNGDKKELCDLVVIFDNNIILFSDKHSAFPSHKDIKIAWARWYNRAIRKSVSQLQGAESWIRKYPDRIFLDQNCRNPFPIPIPDVSKANFYRIAVTRGAYSKCREFYGGQSLGSLLINTGISGMQHLETPFQIGYVDPGKGYVHVLDELTMEILLREFDTITDFVSYLQKKESFLQKPGRLVVAAGEEQLVAIYLTKLNKKNEHDIVGFPDDVAGLSFAEGFWEKYTTNPQYIAKKEADRVSYAWDRLIETFIKNGQIDLGNSKSILYDVEPALRVMASEPRIRRRQLSEYLIEAIKKEVEPGNRFLRLGISYDFPEVAYVFLILPKPDFALTYNDYRNARVNFLLACCKVATLRVPKAKKIVGIATEPMNQRPSSEDLILLEPKENGWTDENEIEAMQLQKELHIFSDETTYAFETHGKEYPDIKDLPIAKDYLEISQSPSGPNRAQRRAMERERHREAKHMSRKNKT